MANGLELLAAYNEPPKNEAVETFTKYLKAIKTSLADPTKLGGKGNWSYKRKGGVVQLKLLGQIRFVPEDKVNGLIDALIEAAKDEKDTAFREKIAEYPGSGLPAAEDETNSEDTKKDATKDQGTKDGKAA